MALSLNKLTYKILEKVTENRVIDYHPAINECQVHLSKAFQRSLWIRNESNKPNKTIYIYTYIHHSINHFNVLKWS